MFSAAITQLVFAGVTGGFYPTVGASGGVFGLLLAYAKYFPNNRVMLIFSPIPMLARTFVVIYAVLELSLGVTGSQGGIAHFVHRGGMIGGFDARCGAVVPSIASSTEPSSLIGGRAPAGSAASVMTGAIGAGEAVSAGRPR